MATELIGKRLGEFEIVRELGRGGMGVVFEAVQTSLGRRVALKVLGPGLGLTPRAVERFRREAVAAAKLHHTNIVPVYATGESGGTHFYAMELIDGSALDAIIRQLREQADLPAAVVRPDLTSTNPYSPSDPLSASGVGSVGGSSGDRFDRIAAMIADVADALHHAHQNGVTHRDIKPSNLLLSSDGRLSVTDFGLARMLEESGMTVTGEFVGTPAYMSPEQITAGRIPVDHRTDLYSLGATLYELLTLRPPFAADGRDRLLAMVLQKEPAPPRSANPKVPRDLETICLKCLEKDPDRRYQTAKELADDLRRYVSRFAILAKRTGPLGRLRKWAKRNPWVAGLAAVVLLALGTAGYFAWRADANHRRFLAEAKVREDEKRRAAIDRGMVAAMTADFAAVRAALAEAETLGASAGELHLVRGFADLYAGRLPEAVSEFRAAVRLRPDSVAATALLAIALGQAGDWEGHDAAIKAAERLTPETPEDRLLLGLALAPIDPAAGLGELRAGLRERPSGIGHVLLADALWQRAANTGTVADADDALRAAEVAARLLPDNAAVEVAAVNARVAASAAHRRVGDIDTARSLAAEASRLAAALSVPPDRYQAFSTRFLVASVRDGLTDPTLSHTSALAFPAGTTEPDIPPLYAIGLLRRGLLDRARAVRLPPGDTFYTTPLKIALALEASDGRPAARAALGGHAGWQDEPTLLLEFIPWLHLTGEADRVPVLAAKLRASGFRYRAAPPADWELVLRHWEGQLTDEAFLSAPASSRPQTSWRHFLVGMKRLGAGDRAGARAAFTATYEAYNFTYLPWEWSHTFLLRMNADPDWPKAIPVKK